MKNGLTVLGVFDSWCQHQAGMECNDVSLILYQAFGIWILFSEITIMFYFSSVVGRIE
jgi:hypothetical protein